VKYESTILFCNSYGYNYFWIIHLYNNKIFIAKDFEMKTDKEIKKMADDHWMWIEGLWQSLPDESVFGLETTEYLYKTAFAHGWKHAQNELSRTPNNKGQ